MTHGILLFLDIGGGELLVILLAVFILFGPSKLPEMAKKIGKVVYDLKKASSDVTREITNETRSVKQEFDKVQQDLKDEAGKIVNDIRKEADPIRQQVPDDPEIGQAKQNNADSI
ncbi:MAG: twin-arginine translocase TatA/TatE family subunit [Bacteroidetes bacterium]|nr:twin-arginine translocase TatA/TatE family subunit [Bacteroidota bacterium]